MQGKVALALAVIAVIAASAVPSAHAETVEVSDRAIAEMSVFGPEMDCPPASLFDYVKNFASFCKLFAKVYPVGSFNTRFKLWKRTVDCIAAQNKKYKSSGVHMQLKANQMADHTAAEIAVRMGAKDTPKPRAAVPAGPAAAAAASRPRFRQQQKTAKAGTGALEASTATATATATASASGEFDWRQSGAVPAPGSQGQCGDCWAWTTKAIVETAWKIAGNTRIDLSAQQITDCDKTSNGCVGGNTGRALEQLRSQGGFCSEKAYPFAMQLKTCNKDCVPTAQIVSSQTINLPQEEQLETLLQKGAVGLALYASDYSFVHYGGGVYKVECNAAMNNPNHAMTAIGYGTDPKDGPYWILKNSWGMYWGENGYMRISRGKNQCNLATQFYTAVAAPAAQLNIKPEDPTGYGQTKRCESVGGTCRYAGMSGCPSGGTKSNPAGLCSKPDEARSSSVECCIDKGKVQKPYVPLPNTGPSEVIVQPRPTGPVQPGPGPVQPPTTPPARPTTPVTPPAPAPRRPTSQYGPCAVAGKSGSCLDVIACSDSKGRVYAGLCPGPKNVMCCMW